MFGFKKKSPGTRETAQRLMGKSEAEIVAYAEFEKAKELKDVMKEVDKRFLHGKDICLRTANALCLKPVGADINYSETKEGVKEFIDEIDSDSDLSNSSNIEDKVAAKAMSPVKNVAHSLHDAIERRQQANLIIEIIQPIYARKKAEERENDVSSKRGCFR